MKKQCFFMKYICQYLKKKKKSFRRIKGLFFSSCLLSQEMQKKRAGEII